MFVCLCNIWKSWPKCALHIIFEYYFKTLCIHFKLFVIIFLNKQKLISHCAKNAKQNEKAIGNKLVDRFYMQWSIIFQSNHDPCEYVLYYVIIICVACRSMQNFPQDLPHRREYGKMSQQSMYRCTHYYPYRTR